MAVMSDKDPYELERLWIDQQLREASWPIEICIGWVLARSEPGAAEACLSFRFVKGLYVPGWPAAAAHLVKDLRSGLIVAEAADERGERRALTESEWRNLELTRIGMSYQAKSAAKVHVFRQIQLQATDVRKRYRALSGAARHARESIRNARTCQQELVKLMKASPDEPISKSELMKRPEFTDISKRAFGRAFTDAAIEADTPAWHRGGRRSKSPQR